MATMTSPEAGGGTSTVSIESGRLVAYGRGKPDCLSTAAWNFMA
jgi:hypothetical protein